MGLQRILLIILGATKIKERIRFHSNINKPYSQKQLPPAEIASKTHSATPPPPIIPHTQPKFTAEEIFSIDGQNSIQNPIN